MPRRIPVASLLPLLGAALWIAASASAQPSYLLFESGPVRPVALTPDGLKLLVTNIPEGHLEIFDVGPHGGLTPAGSVPVGLEPVAVAARTNTEAWVVNHLSDSVSIVDLSGVPRVVRTLLVGDEPRDIVFAGVAEERAFITTAHRGQHRTHDSITSTPGAGDPTLTSPPPVQPPRVPGDAGNPTGDGRADVWVFDASDPGTALGGVPESIVTFFADTPRALAVSPDDSTVYVAAFHSGNQSTTITETAIPDGFANPAPGNPCDGSGNGVGAPGPDDNATGTTDGAPEVGVIVQWNGSDWVDGAGCKWPGLVPFTLPDHDVFALDADTLAQTDVFDHVGTILFNMVVNPVTGRLYVTNQESPNLTLFEGPGDHGGSTVQGHLSESRISVIGPGSALDAQHLNWHIDYDKLHTDPSDPDHATIDGYRPHSLATPLQAVVSSDGETVYVAAFGSAKVGVIDATLLEGACFDEVNETSSSCNPADVFDPTVRSADYLATGGGPSGLALNDDDDRLYVYERFDNTLSVFDVGGGASQKIQTVLLPTAEPSSVIEGRPFLYDAVATSGNGETSCHSCHIFGDLDSLAWNLGDPDGEESANNQPTASPWFAADPVNFVGTTFHPMKGPMTTQTLRGLAAHGAMHWRGDRLDGFFNDPTPTDPDPCTGSSTSNAPCDETRSFDNFIVAFKGLLGRHSDPGSSAIAEADMHKFTDFALQLMLPPNPVRRLDNTLETGSPEDSGEDVYFSCGPGTTECKGPFEPPAGQPDPNATDTIEDCDGCHNLDPASGFFGSGGEQSFENEPQFFKVAHLRNMYAKIGMFSVAGDQIRGFGFLHDGSVDTLNTFLEAPVFSLSNTEETQLEEFMLRFPSDIAPVVGQQASIGPGSPDSCDPTTPGTGCGTCNGGNTTCDDVKERVDLLVAQAGTSFVSFVLGPGPLTECDLIAKTVEGGVQRGYARLASGLFQRDDGGGTISESALRNKAEPGGAAQDIIYTCVPPGSGRRMGIDRDLDSDPANDNDPLTATLDALDNCPAWPNGALLGTCTAGDPALLGSSCTSNADCDPGGFCSMDQEDGDSDGTGDACEPALLPEPGGVLPLLLGAALIVALRRRRLRS